MTLKQWLRLHGSGVTALARSAGVSRETVYSHLRGMPIGTLATAERLSKATGGDVTVLELLRRRGTREHETA